MALRQQLRAGSHKEGGKHQKLAYVSPFLQYFDKKPAERDILGSHKNLDRGESRSRCCKSLQASGGLELVKVHHQQSLRPVGAARCGSNGLRPVKESAHVLLLEQSRPRSLGNRQPRTGCELATVQPPILLSTVSTSPTSLRQVQDSTGGSDAVDSPMVAQQALLPSSARDDLGLQENTTLQQASGGHDLRSATSRPEEAQACRILDFWEVRRESFDLSESSKKLVEASWRDSTEQRYAGAWNKWLNWCSVHQVQAASPSLSQVINYLSSLFDEGLQYHTINLHRLALSSTLKPIDGFCVGQHPSVCRALKG